MDINKILKVMFILSAIAFLITIVSVPRTNCDTCAIEYEGDIIDGVEAFVIFEDGCISYAKPWSTEIILNFSNINFTEVSFP